MNTIRFIAFLGMLMYASSIHAQKLLKLDLVSPLKSGVGVSYEHHVSKRVSFELVLRNLKAPSRCTLDSARQVFCPEAFKNVGREWSVGVLSKYNFFSENGKHDFGIGIGFVGYTFQYNDQFKPTYEEFYKRPYKEPSQLNGLFVGEYNYWILDRLSIGIQMQLFGSFHFDQNQLHAINLTYRL